MDRRQVLKVLSSTVASAAALPMLPGDLYAALRSIPADLPANTALKTLNAHQNATVSIMAETILPRTETPGALDARVNEFIDLMLTDWYEAADRERFLQGLAKVDAQSQELFSKDFVDCTAAQQGEILRLLGEEMSREMQTETSGGSRRHRGYSAEPPANFYFMFRQLVLIGYFTSEVGATQQLHFEVIPNHFDPCAPVEEGKASMSKS